MNYEAALSSLVLSASPTWVLSGNAAPFPGVLAVRGQISLPSPAEAREVAARSLGTACRWWLSDGQPQLTAACFND